MIKRKFISLFMVLLVVLATALVSSYAESTARDDGSLKNAKLLAKSDVLKIAKYHISSYLKYDSQTEGKTITPSEDFINLYDLEDNLFAYIVPLTEKNKGEIGYITIGAIEDGYDAYEVYIDDNAVKDLRVKLKTPETKLVFTPPSSYIVKNEKESKYYGTTKNVNDNEDVSDAVTKNSSEVKKIYKSIRNTENKNHLQKILNYSQTPTTKVDYSDSQHEDVRLVNEAEGSFVPVNDNGTITYGGDQGWWGSSSKATNGCGPTAAANITCYLARKDSSEYGNLYSPSSMSKDDFLTHMNALYTALDPGIAGEFTLTGFRNDVKSYASSKGVTLINSYNDCSSNWDNVASFIKDGLNYDSPVACLNRQPTGYVYGWHWMTITKYFRDIPTDARWIAVSTWGLRKSENFKTYYDSTHSWGGGFVYFR